MVLMWYSVHPEDSGHFRVAIGYTPDNLTLLDPWDRANFNDSDDIQPPLVTYSDKNFCALWNYSESNLNQTYPPYFAAIAVPWSINIYFSENPEPLGLNQTMEVVAEVTYPCPPPFNKSRYIAENTVVELKLLPHMQLTSHSNPSVVHLGNFAPQSQITVKWQVHVNDTLSKSNTTEFLEVTAYGKVSGVVPDTDWGPPYGTIPGYSYSDLIGGSSRVMY